MTEATSSPQPAKSSDTHFHVPTWVAVTIGGLLVLVVGFVIGRVSHRRTISPASPAGPRRRTPAGTRRRLRPLLDLDRLAITGVVLLVRHFSSRTRAESSAEELLADRFARGEISEDEFRSRRAAIRG